MEDAHAAVLDLQAEYDDGQDFEAATVEKRVSFFGVYDGHGGDKVAIFAGENVHKIVAKQDSFKRKDYEQALKDGFLATDRAILNGLLLSSSPTAGEEIDFSGQTPNMRKKSRVAPPPLD